MTRRTWTELDLVVTTPMFLGSADQQHNPDGQWVQSLRGALRFWYRTALAGLVDHDTAEISRHEGAVFGRGGGSASQSGVRLRLLSDPPNVKQELQPSWLKNANGQADPAIAYLLGQGLFSPGSKKHGQTWKVLRPHVPAGARVTLGVAFKPGHEPQLERAFAASMMLLLHHGGLGARSNRGFGGLRVVAVRNAGDFLAGKERLLLDPAAVSHQPISGLTASAASLSPIAGAPAGLPSYPSLQSCRFLDAPQSFASWEDALRHAGTQLRSGRANVKVPGARYWLGRKTDEWLNSVHRNPPGDMPLAGLGLPVVFKKDITLNLFQGGTGTRLASPLFVRALPYGSTKEEPWIVRTLVFDCSPPPGSLQLERSGTRTAVSWGTVKQRVDDVMKEMGS